MSQLIALQKSFQRYVLAPHSVPGWVSHGGRATADKQLSIYSGAYSARLKEVLAIDFPSIVEALGEESFDQLATIYIDTHPSHFYSLREFGRDMPDFLQQAPDYRDQAWLGELALFERMLGQAFDAADTEPFGEQEMARIPPEDWPGLRLLLHPSVQRLDCAWDAPGMWKVLTDETPVEITATQEPSVPWLIWRQNLTTQFRSLVVDEQLALDAVLGGLSIDEVCDALSSVVGEDEVPIRFATLLKSWINQGIISGIE